MTWEYSIVPITYVIKVWVMTKKIRPNTFYIKFDYEKKGFLSIIIACFFSSRKKLLDVWCNSNINYSECLGNMVYNTSECFCNFNCSFVCFIKAIFITWLRKMLRFKHTVVKRMNIIIYSLRIYVQCKYTSFGWIPSLTCEKYVIIKFNVTAGILPICR